MASIVVLINGMDTSNRQCKMILRNSGGSHCFILFEWLVDNYIFYYWNLRLLINNTRIPTMFSVLSLNILPSLDHHKVDILESIGIKTVADLLHYKYIYQSQMTVSYCMHDLAFILASIIIIYFSGTKGISTYSQNWPWLPSLLWQQFVNALKANHILSWIYISCRYIEQWTCKLCEIYCGVYWRSNKLIILENISSKMVEWYHDRNILRFVFRNFVETWIASS